MNRFKNALSVILCSALLLSILPVHADIYCIGVGAVPAAVASDIENITFCMLQFVKTGINLPGHGVIVERSYPDNRNSIVCDMNGMMK